MNISKENNYKLSNILYVGNDLNDYKAMKLCGYTACPVDSHDRIKDISLYVLKTRGGMGIARELVESVFGIDITDILYG
jgi:3-deoxy-D-manno-octulosonate 8-phosphate phosphatase KdsC-like HAD superfamily phosphatase